MRLTTRRLKTLIREELALVLLEQNVPWQMPDVQWTSASTEANDRDHMTDYSFEGLTVDGVSVGDMDFEIVGIPAPADSAAYWLAQSLGLISDEGDAPPHPKAVKDETDELDRLLDDLIAKIEKVEEFTY